VSPKFKFRRFVYYVGNAIILYEPRAEPPLSTTINRFTTIALQVLLKKKRIWVSRAVRVGSAIVMWKKTGEVKAYCNIYKVSTFLGGICAGNPRFIEKIRRTLGMKFVLVPAETPCPGKPVSERPLHSKLKLKVCRYGSVHA
jgi:hypothetical protein